MAIVKVPAAGQFGINRDLSAPTLPNNAWSDGNNVRFLDGYANQSYGYGEIYATPPVVPYHVRPVTVGTTRYWIVAGTGKIYAVNGVTYTNLTRSVGGDYTGTANSWTSCSYSGIPILNDGSGSNYPQFWNLDIATGKFANLTNWPANTYCKSIRTYKNYLVALNITKTATNYPFMVKWSGTADPGALPTWDETDATKDAGEADIGAAYGQILDGLQLRDDFIIYTTGNMVRMSFTGGVYVFAFRPISGASGLLARNCVVELPVGLHFAVTGNDIIIHDGQTVSSVLDKVTRRNFFATLDSDNYSKTFCFVNPYLNEACVAYPEVGNSTPNKLLVYNYVDKTVAFRDIPNLLHADSGLLESGLASTWSADSDPWGADVTVWNQPDFTPDSARVVWASSDTKLYLMDASSSYNGTLPNAWIERRGMTFDAPEAIKLIRGIRPRIQGSSGDTVKVYVGGTTDPWVEPTYTEMTHTIGTTVANDCLVSGRYIAVKFSSGSSYQWRLDNYDIDVEIAGAW